MKISIIIPTIGRKTLNQVLESLLNKKSVQCELELLVIFDGVEPSKLSPDSRESGLVKVFRTPEKVFAGGARNLGITQASGDVLVFLGDDTIPAPDFLDKIYHWHLAHPESHEALLGQVLWVPELAKDKFHNWLSDNAQFDYKRLNIGRTPSWLHFYTSNVSVKRTLIRAEKFSDQFEGWGFEDIEFGYRLAGHGMRLHYDPDLIVYHDDPQTEAGLIERTIQARQNALVFERLHPHLKISPSRVKKKVLKIICLGLYPLSFIPQVKWWRMWKLAWIGN